MELLIGIMGGAALVVGAMLLRGLRSRRLDRRPIQGAMVRYQGQGQNSGPPAPEQGGQTIHALVESDQEPGSNLNVMDSTGGVLIRTREITSRPSGATNLTDASGVNRAAVRRGQQLAAELFKGVATLPGKTIELVFEPHIQQALQDGTMYVASAPDGGIRAWANQAGSNQRAGHGRLVEGGRARQLAAGAMHIASIVVAQSHLEDINRNLDQIKDLVRDVKRYLLDKDRADLVGSLQYLQMLVGMLSRLDDPSDLPIEKRVQLEALRRMTLVWGAQIRLESRALAKKFDQQPDLDGFWSGGGTGNTHKALLELADDAEALVGKYRLSMRLSSLVEVCDAYLAPFHPSYDALHSQKESQELVEVLSEMLMSLRDRSNSLLGGALMNRERKREQRRLELVGRQQEYATAVKQCQVEHDQVSRSLAAHFLRVGENGSGIRMLLDFDSRGEVGALALV